MRQKFPVEATERSESGKKAATSTTKKGGGLNDEFHAAGCGKTDPGRLMDRFNNAANGNTGGGNTGAGRGSSGTKKKPVDVEAGVWTTKGETEECRGRTLV